jgi:hypothetical protein
MGLTGGIGLGVYGIYGGYKFYQLPRSRKRDLL